MAPGEDRTGEDAREREVGEGEEPDPRFTLANERTFLAWNRTALALVSAGAAAAAFLRSGLAGARLVVALPLIALGTVLAVVSIRRWERNERALRLDEPLPRTRLPVILGWSVAVVAAVAGLLAVVDVLVS